MHAELEKLLEQAAAEPAHRPAFFRLLLQADAWVIGQSDDEQVTAESELELQHWQTSDGQTIIPFFTSPQALHGVCGEEVDGLRMPVRTLFELTRGKDLFLNPELPTGKAFSALEISALLDDPANILAVQQRVEGGQSLLLSAVATPPPQLLSSLTTLFSTQKSVRRAFLAEVRETADAPSNLLLGIEAEGDIDALFQLIGNVALDTLPEDTLIDLCEVKAESSGVSHFFSAHIPPFYERRWGSFLREFKGGQRLV